MSQKPLRRVLIVDDEPAIRGMLILLWRWLALRLLRLTMPRLRYTK